MPYKTSETIDLSEDLAGFEDILSVGETHVLYEFKARGIETYEVDIKLKTILNMECAITLKEVPYPIEVSTVEIFTTDKANEEAFIIDGQTLDTKEALLTTILLNKPMKIVADDASFEDDISDDEDDAPINPAFAKLKDLL